jgi:predicted DNA-binding transcriptional regulator AlpA
MKKQYSTVEVAKKLGIAQPNLQRLIRTGRIEAPPIHTLGNVKIRLWSEADIKKAKKSLRGAK